MSSNQFYNFNAETVLSNIVYLILDSASFLTKMQDIGKNLSSIPSNMNI